MLTNGMIHSQRLSISNKQHHQAASRLSQARSSLLAGHGQCAPKSGDIASSQGMLFTATLWHAVHRYTYFEYAVVLSSPM
jgi:hypothetical protein